MEKQKRLAYLLAFVLLLVVEVCIALFVHDAFVRPYVGDVLPVPGNMSSLRARAAGVFVGRGGGRPAMAGAYRNTGPAGYCPWHYYGLHL